jgi:hypothetical protein
MRPTGHQRRERKAPREKRRFVIPGRWFWPPPPVHWPGEGWEVPGHRWLKFHRGAKSWTAGRRMPRVHRHGHSSQLVVYCIAPGEVRPRDFQEFYANAFGGKDTKIHEKVFVVRGIRVPYDAD